MKSKSLNICVGNHTGIQVKRSLNCKVPLAVIDDYSRECPAIEVDTSIDGARVVNLLERLAETRGLPELITMDNDPEFTGRHLDECLNTNWFIDLKHARNVIEDWRRDYNEIRPHSSLNNRTPVEYVKTTAGF